MNIKSVTFLYKNKYCLNHNGYCELTIRYTQKIDVQTSLFIIGELTWKLILVTSKA